MRLRILFISCLCILASLAQGQIERGLRIDLDTQIIAIGDQINLTLELKSHVNDQVLFPEIGDTLSSDVEVVSKSELDTSFGSMLEQRIIRQELQITAWDSGIFDITPVIALINSDTAFGPPFKIGVYTVALDSTNAIVDIKGNYSDPLTFMDYVKAYWHYVAIFHLIGILLILGGYFLKKLKKKEVQVVEKRPEIPAHDIAFQRLNNLEKMQLWQNGKHKEYHVRLSEILREYLENRYHILALEQTTDEILNGLSGYGGMEKSNQLQLHELLSFTDLVKFAKQQPLAGENEKILTNARLIIQQTMIVPLTEDEE